ncbi:MAG: hypothetical protein H6708_22290 [Kofleriaceae bacterium]|nr:hypothetical protein [Kofleriaceae bacterium]
MNEVARDDSVDDETAERRAQIDLPAPSDERRRQVASMLARTLVALALAEQGVTAANDP